MSTNSDFSSDFSREVGPESSAESEFEAGDGGGVGPASAVEDGAERSSVNASPIGNAADAVVSDGFSQVEDELSEDFGDRVVAPRRRPVDTQLRWGDTSWARRHVESLAPELGTFATTQMSEVAALLKCCSYSQLSDEVSAALKKYRPQKRESWAAIEQFVTDACSLAAPATSYTAQLLMTVTTPFVVWCVSEQGWPMQADVVFSRQAINQYCSEENSTKSEGTRRNYRAMLMRISEVVAPEEHPDKLAPLSRKRIAAPYSDKQIADFRKWALGQLTAEKRRRAMLMLVFCVGAGLKSTDVAYVFPNDITDDENGIVIDVKGHAPRRVPLLRDWEEWMRVILEQTDPGTGVPLWGRPNKSTASTVLSKFTQYTTGNKPNAQRLRASWIVTHLQAGTRVKELMRALGQGKFENLPRYLEYVKSLDDAQYREQLRGGEAQ